MILRKTKLKKFRKHILSSKMKRKGQSWSKKEIIKINLIKLPNLVKLLIPIQFKIKIK